MIPPQDAVSKAKKYLLELDPLDNITDLRLEEVEFIESEKLWSITLGFFRLHQNVTITEVNIGKFINPLEKERLDSDNRIYKRLAIDAESGDFKFMRIREKVII